MRLVGMDETVIISSNGHAENVLQLDRTLFQADLPEDLTTSGSENAKSCDFSCFWPSYNSKSFSLLLKIWNLSMHEQKQILMG